MKRVDVAVIGGGPGGYVAALRAAQYGASVVLVEKRELGGTCLNRGCIPTKALLESARVLQRVREAEAFGVSCENPGLDLGKVMRRKDAIVGELRDGVAALLKKRGVTVLEGQGRLLGAGRLRVAGEYEGEVVAERIILATGTVPARPAAFPFDDERVVDSDHFVALHVLPGSVAIVGGGYIGCEFASALSSLGCRVTVVEALPRLLPAADEAVSAELSRAFRRAGVTLHVGTQVEGVEVGRRGGEVRVRLSGGREATAEKVLVAVGRSPCSTELGLEAAGISADDRGFIPVNEHCQTSVPTVYAIGDLTGRAQLAHVATRMGLVAAAHATGRPATVDLRVVPACVFTSPEIASVGLTEAQAKSAGHPVKAVRFPYRALGKAWAAGETDGFFKLVAHADTGEVLGVHIVGARASDIIGEAALALRLECTVEELAGTIHAHPTLHEGLMECAESWLGMGVHG